MDNAAVVEIVRPRRDISVDALESLAGMCERPFFAAFKELVDLMFASFVMVFLLPIFPVICLLIKLDSLGPVFYSQERVGKNSKVFTMYKFRTMLADAERETGPVWSSEDDPRLTRVGKWLRKVYIDELPQCINILRGEMSLVGPRPERPEFMREFEKLVPGFSRRNGVKPGITGLAQVSRFYRMLPTDIRSKLTYDMFYIRKQSCVFDIKIILKTVRFWIHSCLR